MLCLPRLQRHQRLFIKSSLIKVFINCIYRLTVIPMSNKKNARKKITVSSNTFTGDTEGASPSIPQEEVKASAPLELEYLEDEPQIDTDDDDDAMSFMKSKGMRERPDLHGHYRDLNPEQQAEVRELYRAWLTKYHSVTEQQKLATDVFDDPDWNGVFVNDEWGNPHLPLTDTSVRNHYETFTDNFWKGSAESGVECIDLLEEYKLVNSNTGFNSRHHISGWMMSLSLINEAQLARQASHELRIGVEETYYASQIANALHTLALNIKNEVEQMRTLDSHYSALLLGRRLMDIEYQNNDGDFLLTSSFTDKMNTDANNKFIQEISKEQDALREKMAEQEREKEQAYKEDVEAVITQYGHLVCDALDNEQCWS